jgi:GNAT superfamily N-acetyltransferase
MKKLRPRFDSSYLEEIELDDGQDVTLRLVQPSDKQLLLQGFERLSPESRHLRFMGVRNTFNEAELRYLCEVDGTDHFAMGAVIVNADGSEEGVAIARFVRLKDHPDVAEPAITVIDDYQGKGLGRILLKRLTSAARERGIERFHTEFLRGNVKTAQLLNDYEESSIIHEDGDVVTMEFELPRPGLGERMEQALRRSEMYQAFAHIARGALPVRFGRSIRDRL